MREIVLDTETTGINPLAGHRIIEVAAVEMVDRKLTGNTFHSYINPKRAVDEGAFRVHGISNAFLEDKPLFAEIAQDLLAFIDNSLLIIHNAPFDLGFLNNELALLKAAKTIEEHCSIVDTLVLARTKHPGQRNNLDALCKRYHVNNANRNLHGALLDAELLALVYLAMTGGQASLFEEEAEVLPETCLPITETTRVQGLVLEANAEELKRHQEFVEFLRKKSGVDLWEGES